MKGKSIIIVLVIILLGLVGYICYDMVIAPKSLECDCNCPDCTVTKNDINEGQDIKVYYFVSNFGKTAYHDGRVALTLYATPNDSGLFYGNFSLDIAYGNEFNSVAEGNFDVKEGKLMLTMNSSEEPYVTTAVSTFERELGVSVSATDMENWYIYQTSYDASEIKIGDIKLYAVNK